MNKMIEAITLKTSDVVFRKDLYPRKQGDPSKVKEYGANLSVLPPIEVNQKNELIDGWHRWTAHAENKQETIKAVVTETADEVEFLELAIRRNNSFGMQLSNSDKRSLAVKIYKSTPIEDRVTKKTTLAELLSVEEKTIYNWTSDIDYAAKSERNALILKLHLQCRTQQEIADAVGMDRASISRVLCEIEKFQICTNPSDFDKFTDEERSKAVVDHNTNLAQFAEFAPPVYNIWSYGKKTNAVDHFGNTEQRIVENLLWLYTQPFDIVVDPFAGGGSSLDVCASRFRRCFASDRKPVESRGESIRNHDACSGAPSLSWSDVSLVYLDPPYWRQAEGEYSNDAEDLANMPLGEFTDKMAKVVNSFAKKLKPGAVIAMIIQPTQWKSEPKGAFSDHVFDIVAAVGNKSLVVENRISCPYSTEQCLAQMVEWSKENKKPLVLTRELVIWRKQ